MGDDEPEQGAKGRRWKVSICLAIFGAGVLVAGLVLDRSEATIVGAVIVVAFGMVAAGARKTSVSSDLIQVETEFDAPPPPAAAQESGRKIYMPRGRRSRR